MPEDNIKPIDRISLIEVNEYGRARGVKGVYTIRYGTREYLEENVGTVLRVIDRNRFPIPVEKITEMGLTKEQVFELLDGLEKDYSIEIGEIKDCL